MTRFYEALVTKAEIERRFEKRFPNLFLCVIWEKTMGGLVMEEVWKDVKGYEGLYMVSSFGRVKSLDRIDSMGRKRFGRFLKCTPSKFGYPRVSLVKDGRPQYISVHRLVAINFIPNPSHKPEVNHIDANKNNNCVNNLEWVTPKENSNHAIKLNLNKSTVGLRGSMNKQAKLNEDKVIEIKKRIEQGEQNKDIAASLEICKATVSDIKRGRRWSHVQIS